MNAQHLDDLELGRRVVLHFAIENDLHRTSRIAAIAIRATVFE